MSCRHTRKSVITIERNTPAKDSCNQPVESWATLVADVMANVLKPTTSERFTGVQHFGTKKLSWVIDYREDLTELDRVVYRSDQYNITGLHILDDTSEIVILGERIK